RKHQGVEAPDASTAPEFDALLPHAATQCSSAVLLMADATGHGIGPALSVTQLRSMLRMAVRLGAGVRRIADHVNQQLCHDLPSGRFITAWIGVLDAGKNRLTSYSAGQAPLIRYRANADSFEELDADTVPFGVASMIEAAEPVVIDLEPGDLF